MTISLHSVTVLINLLVTYKIKHCVGVTVGDAGERNTSRYTLPYKFFTAGQNPKKDYETQHSRCTNSRLARTTRQANNHHMATLTMADQQPAYQAEKLPA